MPSHGPIVTKNKQNKWSGQSSINHICMFKYGHGVWSTDLTFILGRHNISCYVCIADLSIKYLKQLIVRAHTSGSNHQVQSSEVNNTLDNNTNRLSTKILLSYILHCIRTSATYKNITMEHVIMESGQLNGGCWLRMGNVWQPKTSEHSGIIKIQLDTIIFWY